MSSKADRRFARYRDIYARAWRDCEVLPHRRREVESAVSRMLVHKPRYLAIQRQTGVPWWFTAIVHKMECNLSFEKHLHNGDSLQARTWRVPKGRPKTHAGPFTFEESAADALTYDGIPQVKAWSIERAAFMFEKYNGYGYHSRGINSPYLWSFSNQYARGKFERDHVYNPNLVSEQTGAMVLLKALMARDSSIVLRGEADPPPPTPANEDEQLPRADDKPLAKSGTLYGLVAAAFAWVVSSIAAAFGWLSDVTTGALREIVEIAKESQDMLAPLWEMAATIGLNWSGIIAALFVFGIVVAGVARLTAHWQKRIG